MNCLVIILVRDREQKNIAQIDPNNKVYGANMGPTWDQQDPGGPHVGPMNLAIWGVLQNTITGYVSEIFAEK